MFDWICVSHEEHGFVYYSFLAFNALVVYVYHTKYLGVDDESIRNDVLTEGLMNSFGLFLVCQLFRAVRTVFTPAAREVCVVVDIDLSVVQVVWICAYSFILPSK